jgi:hypothetical protein
MKTKVRDSMIWRSRAKTSSNSGGYPRHISDQNSKERKPRHISPRSPQTVSHKE